MSDIKRTGPPSARDVKGKVVTWTVPLSAMPGKEWRQFFVQTRDTTVTCNPSQVHIYQGLLVFESIEEDVPSWISFIDKWMAAANTRQAELEQASRPAGASTADTRNRDQRLADLNEKFKD